MSSRFVLAALAAIVSLLAPLAVDAQPPSGAVANVMMAAELLEHTGMEVEVAADGNGIFVVFIAPDHITSTGRYVFTIDDASRLDQATAVITPTFKFGPASLTSVIREGRDSTGGALSTEGTFYWSKTPMRMGEHQIFVPPGKFFTVRTAAVNTATDITVGFVEAQR